MALANCIRISQELTEWLAADDFTVIEEGEYPACAVSFDGAHLLLVRHFGYAFTISLPILESFSCRSEDELKQQIPEIQRAISAYRLKYPASITMADAVIQLRPAVQAIDVAWVLDIPGAPVPSEAWLNSKSYTIGLFQEEGSVKVVVWVGSGMRSFVMTSTQRLAEVGTWVIPQLKEQVKAATELAAAEKKAAALPAPTLEAALAAMRTGTQLQLGAGRWYETYFLTEGKLRRGIFDEGHYDEEDATEEQLRAALKDHAVQARQQL